MKMTVRRQSITVAALVTALAALLIAGACGWLLPGGNIPVAPETTTEEPAPPPAGIWVIQYLGNASGAYVENFNMVETDTGEKVNFLKISTEVNGETAYFRLDENGSGTFTNFSAQPVAVTLDLETIRFADGTERPYTRDGDLLWFESEPGCYMILRNVSEAHLQKVLNGAYDCMPPEAAKIGDLVALGEYDTIPGNDRKEPLKWRVIDKNGDRLLVICDRLIDSRAFNDAADADENALTWETSTLRQFLNNDFMADVFTATDAERILTTRVENKSQAALLNLLWGNLEDKGETAYSVMRQQTGSDEPDTDDKVFLLSVEEVLRYFGDEVRQPEDVSDDNYPFSVMDVYPHAIAYVTEAAADSGKGYYSRETLGGAWMTRTLSTGNHGWKQITYVAGDGQIFNYYTDKALFIRPAMWIAAG